MTAPGRERLPLFPLPAVLFPTQIMPLHVFEPRYRRLVARCLETDRRFGLLYHDPDRQGPFLTEEGRVGCVAEIREARALPDGRSLVTARGTTRFRIVDGIESEEPYYEGLVTAYHDVDRANEDRLAFQRRRLLTLFQRVLDALPDDPERLPELDPGRDVSFPLVRTIDVEPGWQQGFLEMRDESHRLERLEAVFRAALE